MRTTTSSQIRNLFSTFEPPAESLRERYVHFRRERGWRASAALALARAEHEGAVRGYVTARVPDEDADLSDLDEATRKKVESVEGNVLASPVRLPDHVHYTRTRHVRVEHPRACASLWSIIDPDEAMLRDTFAELCLEILACEAADRALDAEALRYCAL